VKSLIVEDEFTSRMQIKYFLEEYGSVDVAVNGTEAVEAYKMALAANKPYNRICLEIKLPEKDGHQVLEEIRRFEARKGQFFEKAVIIFMTTAVSNIESVYDSRGLCNEYLLKPIEKAMLEVRLRKYNLIR
jgi:two-component system chemotaxis response regulator CheY